MKRDTKRVGDIAESMIMARLIEAGFCVSVPFGENQRYDLILDDGARPARVQVKSGRLRNGAVLFNCYSSHQHRGGAASRRYVGESSSSPSTVPTST